MHGSPIVALVHTVDEIHVSKGSSASPHSFVDVQFVGNVSKDSPQSANIISPCGTGHSPHIVVGLAVGLTLGLTLGEREGLVLGEREGLTDGLTLGLTVGLTLGFGEGEREGLWEGDTLGLSEGL